MAYLAMARKWRPRNFEEMVGQDHIAQTIRNAIDGKRISHAYLFTGTRGVGKTTSARILAKALNCLNGPTPTPCDACDNCKAVNAGNSMDVLEIDGASNNGVDNIRELREQVKYAPMHGTYKIYIVDEVHMLSKPAFNALLKTLEEPPPHVVFIFATTEAGKVPHTILSRVQRFDFKRISETHIRERLEYICTQEAIKPEREALEAIARKADGSMRDALSLFDQVYAYAGADLSMEAARKVLGLPREAMFDALVRALVKHDQKECFTIIQDSHREGIETSEFLIAFGEYLRNLLFARQGVTPAVLGLSEPRFNEICSIAPELRDGDVIRFAKMISDMLAALKTAANPRLAVELGFARMASLDRVVTLSQVLGQELPPSTTNAAADPDGVKKKNPVELIQVATAPPPPAKNLEPATPEIAALATRPANPEFPTLSDEESAAFDAQPPAESFSDPEPSESAAAALLSQLSSPHQSHSPPAPSPLETASLNAPSTAPAKTAVEVTADHGGGGSYAPTDRYSGGGMEPVNGGDDADQVDQADQLDQMEADDTEFPELRNFPIPPSRGNPQATPDEVSEVPMQDDAAALPELWPRLVAEFMAERPLLGSHLRQSRLVWDDGGAAAGVTRGLQVIFTEKSAYFLVGEDADAKKSVQGFLASKLKNRLDGPLRFSLDPEVAAGAEAAEAMHVPMGGVEDDMRREPILRIIQNMFDGRLIN